MWGAIIPAAISAVGSLIGGYSANQANQSMASAQMAFQQQSQAASAEVARESMTRQEQMQRESMTRQENMQRWSVSNAQDFAREMSGTAYQRGMADMRAAGLNPILAYGQGGATAPTVGTVSGPSGQSGPSGSIPAMSGASARMEDVISPAISNAIQGSRVMSELQQLSENIKRTGAETRVLEAQESQVRANTAVEVERARSEGLRPGLIEAETDLARGRLAEARANAARLSQEVEFSRNWGPSGPVRDLAVSGEQVFTRALGAVRAGITDVEAVARAVWGEGVSLTNATRLMIENLIRLGRQIQ